MTTVSGTMTLAQLYAVNNVPAVLRRSEVAQVVEIKHIDVKPLNAALTNPFPIASDRTTRIDKVDNVLVSITSRDGIVGLGEAAPFYGISGDTQDVLLRDLGTAAELLAGSAFSVFQFEHFARAALTFPSARAALEMAFFDILAKREGVPLYALLNPDAVRRTHVTDVTIPVVPHDQALTLAEEYLARGFGRIKVKLGGDVYDDRLRVFAAHATYGAAGRTDALDILIDANESYTAGSIATLIHGLLEFGITPKIFEQPVQRENLYGLGYARRLSNNFGIDVFADEAVYTLEDAQKAIDEKAVDGINLKLMKHGGIIEAMRIAELAMRSGLELMVGGMMETRLAMTASLHVAHAIGEVHWFDLDTPLLIEENILAGGTVYDGPRMTLPDAPGIGVTKIVTRDT